MMMRRLETRLAARAAGILMLASSVARAQQPPQAPAATSVIRGRIVAADTGRPLRRAQISLASADLGVQGRTTTTNVDGKFQFKELAAGRYTLTVTRSGYLTLRYGQRRPLEPGKPLQLLDRQTIDNVDFSLPKMSVISGRVTDETADPIAGVQVMAMRWAYFEGRRRIVPAGESRARTDDTGRYRILGLPPGTYFVLATTRETWTANTGGTKRLMGFAPTYFPGITNVATAAKITVGIGHEARGTDFSLVPGRTATVSGTAVDAQGRPIAGQTIGLTQEFRSAEFGGSYSSAGSAAVAADGTFAIRNVPPGDYKLQARISSRGAGVQQEAATLSIVVDGADVTDIALRAAIGWSMSGSVTLETGTVPSLPRDRVRVTARQLNESRNPRVGGQLKDDWTFSVKDVFGPAHLRVTVPDGWMVKSILHEGRDVTDAPLESKRGEEMSGLQVMLSNRVTTVTAQISDDKGAATSEGTVIVFASDAEKWNEDSRFVRMARPDQQGQVQVMGLPPGEYLAVAVEYVQDGMWNDPEYLESLRRYARKLNLTEGSSQTIALKLVMP